LPGKIGRTNNLNGTYKKQKPCNVALSIEPREYEIDGKIFIVKPVYKEKSNESVTSILIKLLKSEK